MRLSGTIAVGFGIVSALAVGSTRADAGAAIVFAPHRAIYEITLDRAGSGSGVVELAGRMVYELQGSRCEGYTQNMRFVTRMIAQDGSEQISDLRSSSWEDGQGTRLRFNSEQYKDSKLVEATAGDAKRRSPGGDIEVQVTKPGKEKLTLPARIYFPMQHSQGMLTAAMAGQRQFLVGLYDGSEKGAKVYDTSAWIGARADKAPANVPPALASVPSWQVSIGYFEPDKSGKDTLPSYELSFRIFANGVSSDMRIDYGDFAVRGELTELSFLPVSECPQGPAAKVAPRR